MKLQHLIFVPPLIVILNSTTVRTQAGSTTRPPPEPASQRVFCTAATKATHYALEHVIENNSLPDFLPPSLPKHFKYKFKNNHQERQRIFSTLFKLLSDLTALPSDPFKESIPPLDTFMQELKTNLTPFQTLIDTSATSARLANDLYSQTLEVATEASLLAVLIARESCPPYTDLGRGYFTSYSARGDADLKSKIFKFK